MAKLTKKATPKIIELVRAIDTGMGKNISFDEAWDIIGEYIGVEVEMVCNTNNVTTMVMYKGDDEIGKLSWNNVFIKENGDWDWNRIYKDAIEYMMKNKIVKKPRQSHPQKKTNNNIINKKSTLNEAQDNIDDLKKKKQSLYQKLRKWKMKGKDVTVLQKEYDNICSALKSGK